LERCDRIARTRQKNITCVIDPKRTPDTIKALHQEFKLEALRPV
jgi:aspartokinase